MEMQFINMEAMQLIICSESWKYQILFNCLIFEIALRYKHESKHLSRKLPLWATRVLQTTTNIFCSPSHHISFPLLKGQGFFFFKNMPFLIQVFYLHKCTWAHACICKIEFPQRINSVLMRQDFPFKHREGRNKPCWLPACTMPSGLHCSVLPPLQLEEPRSAAAPEPLRGLRRQFKVTFGKTQTTATEISISYLK